MREILFRGERVGSEEWVEGFYLTSPEFDNQEVAVITTDKPRNPYYVSKETIGQYTGLTDKNGKKIFEGDIVKAQDDIFGSPFCNGITGKIVYAETAFFIEPKNPMESQWLFNECAVYEIIGNIHDNPELLKECDNNV